MAHQSSTPRRFGIVAPVRVVSIDPETDPKTGERIFRASGEVCANLSRGGAFIRTSDAVEPGRRLLVQIHLPGGAVEAVGRVAWSKRTLSPEGSVDSGMGVEFLGASPEDESTLQHYIEARERDEAEEAG